MKRKTKTAARRLVVRSFMGFGSRSCLAATGFRAGRHSGGTMSSKDWESYPDGLRLVIARFCGVVIEHKPAVDVLHHHDNPQTLHFVDPPYLPASRTSRHKYSHEMDAAQHGELAAVLRKLTGMVVLSGYRSALYEELYQGWRSVERKAFAFMAVEKTEVLWLNDAAWNGGGRLL